MTNLANKGTFSYIFKRHTTSTRPGWNSTATFLLEKKNVHKSYLKKATK